MTSSLFQTAWPELTATSIWLPLGASAARVLPIAFLVPIFGGRWVPLWARLAIGGVIVMAVAPAIGSSAAATSIWDGLAVLAGNLLIGLTLGITGALVFYGVEAAGALIDSAIGPGDGRIANATLTEPDGQGPMQRLFALLAVTLFFVVGGHRLLIAAVADSFRLLPPMLAPPEAWIGTATTDALIALSGSVFVLAIQIAAPAIVVALIVDVLAGLLHRFAQPVPAFFLALTLKGVLATGAVFVALGVIVATLRGQFAEMARALIAISRIGAGA